MASSRSFSCLGCLGGIISLTFIGGLIFGFASFSIRIGSFGFGIGTTRGTQQENTVNSTDLESEGKAIEKAVNQFHEQLNQGKCQEIYQQTNEIFKQYTSQSDFLSACQHIRNNWGTVKSSQLNDLWWHPTNQDANKYILSRYSSSFTNGSVEETFIWVEKDGKLELGNYQPFIVQSLTSPSPTAKP